MSNTTNPLNVADELEMLVKAHEKRVNNGTCTPDEYILFSAKLHDLLLASKAEEADRAVKLFARGLDDSDFITAMADRIATLTAQRKEADRE